MFIGNTYHYYTIHTDISFKITDNYDAGMYS